MPVGETRKEEEVTSQQLPFCHGRTKYNQFRPIFPFVNQFQTVAGTADIVIKRQQSVQNTSVV